MIRATMKENGRIGTGRGPGRGREGTERGPGGDREGTESGQEGTDREDTAGKWEGPERGLAPLFGIRTEVASSPRTG